MAARAIALATRVACNEEGDGISNKGDGNEGGGQTMVKKAIATMWAMAAVMRVAGDKKDKGEDGKSNGESNVRVVGKEEVCGQVNYNGKEEGNGNGDKGGGQSTVTVTKRVMAMAMRVVGNKEGNGDGGKSDGNDNKCDG
jgi:hypothetical protein